MKKRVALLGATGSIGKSTLDVIRAGCDDFELVLISGHTNAASLSALSGEFKNAKTVLSGSGDGREKLLAAISGIKADITVNGISGAAGLEPSFAAINSGSDLALANKETVVMAGPLLFRTAAEKKVKILPVDSEHSGVFHLIAAHGDANIDEIILTASGGPFRKFTIDQMRKVTPREALAHPTWNMGPKITIDSASLANKGLEVIEAAQLFNVSAEKIRVVVHPQSVVHSMVRMKDGAVFAQLSEPDMRLPVHEALYWPEVKVSSWGKLDFDCLNLEFEKPDMEKFPMLPLAYEAVRRGGLNPCAYNGANEIAAAAFLNSEIGFLDIPRIVEYVLTGDWEGHGEGIRTILEADKKARDMALAFIKKESEEKR
ncbi:MAG: 1-deoxy-D-xylulose-5-phosphate reductoisomerase [Treponema sp.]|nr:1-deoxy-D-xylulose-5-phosphate reductoisomerase [Treponema sp.]